MAPVNGQGTPGVAAVESGSGHLLHGAFRGTIGAMAMTGMRSFTEAAGIIGETPPEAIFRQRLAFLLPPMQRRKRKVRIELAHWGYGAAGGAAFAALPEQIRLKPWAGPVYGLGIWLSFELAIAPALDLSQAKRVRFKERIAFAVDHLLYGLVLTETRRRPPR